MNPMPSFSFLIHNGFVFTTHKTPPETGTHLVNIIANVIRDLEAAHTIRSNCLSYCLNQDLFPTSREKLFFPPLQHFPDSDFNAIEKLFLTTVRLRWHVKVLTQGVCISTTQNARYFHFLIHRNILARHEGGLVKVNHLTRSSFVVQKGLLDPSAICNLNSAKNETIIYKKQMR